MFRLIVCYTFTSMVDFIMKMVLGLGLVLGLGFQLLQHLGQD